MHKQPSSSSNCDAIASQKTKIEKNYELRNSQKHKSNCHSKHVTQHRRTHLPLVSQEVAVHRSGLGDILGGEGLVGSSQQHVRRELAANDGYVRGQVHAEHAQHTSILGVVTALELWRNRSNKGGVFHPAADTRRRRRRIRHLRGPGTRQPYPTFPPQALLLSPSCARGTLGGNNRSPEIKRRRDARDFPMCRRVGKESRAGFGGSTEKEGIGEEGERRGVRFLGLCRGGEEGKEGRKGRSEVKEWW